MNDEKRTCECWCGCQKLFEPYFAGQFWKLLIEDECEDCHEGRHYLPNPNEIKPIFA